MDVSEASFQIIADLLEARTGQHLTESRRWRVNSALAGIFRTYGITNVDQLVCLLAAPPTTAGGADLAQEVVEALLNNETYFFRDKPTFDQLPGEILPELARRRRDSRRLSIWSAGCSTGQEAYSLAMLFIEQAEQWQGWHIDILGTDVSQRAVAAARSGLYSQFEVQRGLGVTQMLRHFDETARGWQVRDEVRRMVRFSQANLLGPSPGRMPFDLVLCRNVLLYFDRPTRSAAFNRLSSAVMPDGFLMLGAGETVVGQTDRFVPTSRRASFFELASPAAAASLQKIA
ncbi:CheR family methyltransferase [Erythrobacter sp. BLCC-B19]|uniref:CheR family methyltransferase n=1 Tax=Erythrobacter sp. BLCC-B19 TaxID=3025315 RepID=UPI00235F81DA|nr:protein-glutamate O-methyltransferase CheR [Erythrobacter sp. BLCC-B19]WDA41695.1 protein-glutamate O-methyltransferase CheR [Erythrobacter sp. BLCC-B19]